MTDGERASSEGEMRRNLMYALDRLAIGFESADPHIRHEAKMVAKQNIGQIAEDLEHAG